MFQFTFHFMTIAQQRIFHQLTGKTNLSDARLETLFEMEEKHPYFSPLQFFLTLKLREENHKNYEKQLHKTAIYFNNPHWLHYQLMPTKPEFIEFIEKNKSTDSIQPILQHVIEDEIKNSQIKYEEKQEEEKELIPIIQANQEEDETKEEIEEKNEIETIDEQANKEEEMQQPSLTSFALESAEENVAINSSVTLQEIQEVEKAEDVEKLEEIEEVDEKLSKIIKQQLDTFNTPVTEETELIIEQTPQHSIDYFESQGIKAEITDNANDNLSHKLRKFTDWLKHMKTISLETDKDLGTDPELENAIQNIAQNSNESREIVTETMAEVLEKQGKKDKAIQLYIKLSFLNPDKSSYFAAKIQQLKGI